MTATLFHGGVVYAPGQPEATAVLVEADRVAWVGDDATGQQLETDAEPVFLDGGLITALPVDLRLGAADHPERGLVSAQREDVIVLASDLVADPEILPSRLGELGAQPHRGVAVLCDADAGPVVHQLANLQQQGVRMGRVRLQLEQGAQFDPELLGVLPPMVQVVVNISAHAPDIPLHGLVSAGFVLGLISDGSPWEGMKAAINHSADPMSGRAAYQAYTRSPWRMMGVQDAGAVAVGQKAHLGVWQAESLTIQVPRIQDNLGSWSTDARARSGMLPDLSENSPLPQLVMSVIHGHMHVPR